MVDFEMAYLIGRMVDIYNQLSHLHFCFNIFSLRIQTNQANRLLLPFFTSPNNEAIELKQNFFDYIQEV